MGNWNRKSFRARYPGRCFKCHIAYPAGTEIALVVVGAGRGARGGNKYAHILCAPSVPFRENAPAQEAPSPAPPIPPKFEMDMGIEEFRKAGEEAQKELDRILEEENAKSSEEKGKGAL